MLEKNLYENEDPSWQMHMQTLTMRKKNMEIAQTIDDALYNYYFERGMNVPKWKRTDTKWWVEYLDSLGIDPRNP